MKCSGSWALSRAPGGVFCKPASAPGWLLGGITATHFPQGGKRTGIATCLFVRSIFWRLWGGAEPALLTPWAMGWAGTSVLLWEREQILHQRLVLFYPRITKWCCFPEPVCPATCDVTRVTIPAVPLALQLAERLKLSDPLLLEMPEQDQALEPDWLEQLRAHCQELEVRRSEDAVGQLGCAVLCLQEHPPPLP